MALSAKGTVNLKCPSCARLMVEVVLSEKDLSGGAHQLHLDVCRSCHFLWFDPSELEQIPEKLPPEPSLEDGLPQEVKEKLALKKIAEIRDRAYEDEPSSSHNMSSLSKLDIARKPDIGTVDKDSLRTITFLETGNGEDQNKDN